jgi:hypothetical protein
MTRQCGPCNMCCSTHAVPSIDKPRDEQCHHLSKGRCGIYSQRPQECNVFDCLWLQGIVPKELRPDKVNAVVSANISGDVITVHILPKHRGAHKKSVLRSWIERVADGGVSVIVLCGDERLLFGPPPKPQMYQLRGK